MLHFSHLCFCWDFFRFLGYYSSRVILVCIMRYPAWVMKVSRHDIVVDVVVEMLSGVLVFKNNMFTFHSLRFLSRSPPLRDVKLFG